MAAPILPTDGPAPAATETLASADGTRLSASFYGAGGERALIAILHGYGDHAGRFARLAGDLAAAGYGAAALDLRGHGRSAGQRGYCRRFTEYLDDLTALLAALAPRAAMRPVFLLGHSHGGLVALRYALAVAESTAAAPVPLAGVIASSPFLGLRLNVSPLKLLVGRAADRLFPRLSLPSSIPADQLTHDPAVAQAYDADPLRHKAATARWFGESRRAQEEVLERAAAIRLPALFLVAGADTIADSARTEAVFARLGTPAAARGLRVYPGLRHELFNELDHAAPLGDLLDWLDSHLAHDPALRDLSGTAIL